MRIVEMKFQSGNEKEFRMCPLLNGSRLAKGVQWDATTRAVRNVVSNALNSVACRQESIKLFMKLVENMFD